jgi:hypothetical protein
LLEASAGALLNGELLCQGLHELLAFPQGLEQGLPLLLELFEALLHPAVFLSVGLQLLLKISETISVLPLTLQELLLLLLQRGQLSLELEATGAALPLFLDPGTGAPGHITKAAAGDLHSGFRVTAEPFGIVKVLLSGVGHQLLPFLLVLAATVVQIVAEALEPFAFLLMQSRLPFQVPPPGVEAGELRLHAQQLVFAEGFTLS